MRYRRLKKNIETKLAENGENGKKETVRSTKVPHAKKVKDTIGSNKKRKVSYESGNEDRGAATLNDEIGHVTIKDEEFQEWTIGPRTRSKKIDLKDAFESDSSNGPGLRTQDDGSSDDYKMEDVSKDEEEFHTDDDEEDDQSASRRRKSGSQSAHGKMTTAEFATTAFKISSEAIPRSVPDNYAKKTVSKSKMSVTPSPRLSSRSETKGKTITLPPTPQSIPSGLDMLKPVEPTLTARKSGRGASQMSPAARTKQIRQAPPQLSIFDRIEKARVQADYNLAFLSHKANKASRSIGSPKLSSDTVLPSIEHDEGDKEITISNASSKSSSMIITPPVLQPTALSLTTIS